MKKYLFRRVNDVVPRKESSRLIFLRMAEKWWALKMVMGTCYLLLIGGWHALGSDTWSSSRGKTGRIIDRLTVTSFLSRPSQRGNWKNSTVPPSFCRNGRDRKKKERQQVARRVCCYILLTGGDLAEVACRSNLLVEEEKNMESTWPRAAASQMITRDILLSGVVRPSTTI